MGSELIDPVMLREMLLLLFRGCVTGGVVLVGLALAGVGMDRRVK